jgi:osmotically-inducible protein OsmY
MADDRYRYDRDRFRDRDEFRDRDRDDYGRREDDGYIARRGFGNRSSGFGWGRSEEGGRSGVERGGSYGPGWDDRSLERGGSQGRWEDRYGGGRERDFGDSAGYGSGGSARDWRDVMGGDRGWGREGYGGSRERGYGGFLGREGSWGERGSSGGFMGRDDPGRYGASDFGRGSRGDYDERGFFERAGDEVRSWFGDDEAERRRERDAREGEWSAQHHRGRGPKGYARSDERIREDVNDRLTDDPHLDASEIEVTVQNREVTLSGTVNSRSEKRRAEDIAESVSGVTHVQNNLRVQQPAGMGTPGTGSSLGAGAGSASGAGLNLGATGTAAGAGSSTGTQGATSGAARRRTSTQSGA